MATTYIRGHEICSIDFKAQTNLKVLITGNLESVLTKDSTAGYDDQELASCGWQVQIDCYETSDLGQAKSLIEEWKSDATSVTTDVGSGNAILTQLDIDCTNRQKIKISATWTGVGEFTPRS